MWAVTAWAVVVSAFVVKWRRSGQGFREFLVTHVVAGYARLWHRCSVVRHGPKPSKGPGILVANHTCSADAAFLLAGLARPIGFLVAAEYYRLPGLAWVFDALDCVPVARTGRDVAAVRQSLARLSEGRLVSVFPEGGLSNAGRTRFRRGKAGVAYLALRSRAPVYAVHIAGGPQTSSIARAWFRPSHVRIAVGPAVHLTGYYDRPITRKLLEEVTTLLMNRVAQLPLTPRPRAVSHPFRRQP